MSVDFSPVFNIKQNLAKKLDPILKSSNLKEITYHTHFQKQNSENYVHAVVER